MHAHRGDVFASLAARPRNLIAAGHEDCNDADHLKVNPALRLALDKKYKNGGRANPHFLALRTISS